MIWPRGTPRRRFLRGRRGGAAGDGTGWRRRSLLAALSALTAAAGLALVSPSAGDVTNTWSGTWVNSAPDGTFWVFTQSGATVGGVWKGNANSGSLSGTVQGSNLSGTLVNNEAGQSANFSITLAADGRSFSGTFTIVGGSTGQWRSACSGGACLSNAAPPPPPPPPPGGGSPAAQVSPKLLAAATAWGQVGPASALEPGGEAIATSPPIAAKQRGASVTLSGDVSGETALVFGPGQRIQQEVGRLTRGDCVRAVGGAFKFALDSEAGRLGGRSKKYDPRLDEQIRANALGFATYFMVACLDFVEELDRTPVARAAARVSCRLSGRQLSVRVDRAADTIHYRTRRASRRAPARLLRGSCRQARNGTVTLRIRTASRRIKLRKVLGPRLVVGAYRSVGASGSANVQMTFKRR